MMKRIKIVKEFEFEAAHNLPWHKGACFNLHGHSYRLQVGISGELNENGVLMDFSDLKRIVNESVITYCDHKNLNEQWKNPTAEIMAKSMMDIIQAALPVGVKCCLIRLWETSTSHVEVTLWEAT